MDRDRIAALLRSALLPFGWVRWAYLFGSIARGQERPGSDVDVGIYADHDPSLKELIELDVAFCRACDRDDVQSVVLNERGPAFLTHVLEDGILLLDRDHDERVLWQARVMSEWYDFAPTYELWREGYLRPRPEERAHGPAPRH